MTLVDLTARDRETVRRCIAAMAFGPFLDDAEFRTRIGIDRRGVASLLAAWPQLDDKDDHSDISLALNNCMNEVCHGVPIPDSDWGFWFDRPRIEVLEVFENWCRSRGWGSSGVR